MDSRFEVIDRRFDEVKKRFDAVDQRFDEVDKRFEKVEIRLDRVGNRLDSVESKLTSLDDRVEQLETKQYDTKPIWEQALVAIAETKEKMEQGFQLVRTELRTEFRDGIAGLRAEMKSEFSTSRTDMEDALHAVEWKIDALNQNILKIRADQRYTDRRLHELETHTKAT